MVDLECLVLTGVGIVGFLALLKYYMAGGVYYGKETMVGKTIVITGANTGIGKETVRELATRGARIIMGCRNMEKAKKACEDIHRLTNNKNVEYRKLDLSSFDSVRAFAKSILETESRIDVLINNAGLYAPNRNVTGDGFEEMIQTNHYAHFLLTNLLLDKLKASAPSRIVILSSIGHEYGKMNFDDLNSEKSYSAFGAYAQSKIANVLHALELSKRLQGTGVTVNSLHPGVVSTELDRYLSYRFLYAPLKYFTFKSIQQGAQTTLRLAIDPSLENVTAKYFSDCKEKPAAPEARDEAAAKKLWEISETATKKKD